jgi:hypothetical protein
VTLAADAADPYPEPVAAGPTGDAAAFLALLADAWRGRPDPSLDERARVLGIDTPLDPETQRPPRAPALPDVATLARIAADHDPAVGAVGPDLVLGPWADTADRATLLAAVAHCAFVSSDGTPHPPVVWHRRGRPSPTPTLRAGLTAVGQAPLAPWRVREVRAEGAMLEDLVGLGAAAPTTPVRLDFSAPLVVARVAWEQEVPVAVAPIALPAWPPSHVVARWWTWLTWEARLVHRAHTAADVLRWRGHTFARRLLGWSWHP